MHIRGLIFDLDDTLVDSRQAFAFALAETLSREDLARFEEARRNVKARLPARHPSARNRWLYFKELLELGGRFSATALVAAAERYEQALARSFRDQWQRLARAPLLERLGKRYAIGVVTNETVRSQTLKLAALDPTGVFFPRLICSEDYGVEKPDQSLLQAMLKRLELPAPAVCVIGNSLIDDVEPARAIGCAAVWTTEFYADAGGRELAAEIARVGRLDELEAHLDARL